MSKVYSFRLDENNPREAQAQEIIETWVAQGYSLRHQLVDALLKFQNENFQNKHYVELFEKIEQLISISKEGKNKELVETSEGIFTKTFVESISNSVKSGMKIE